jgi:acetyl esterase/lipase
MPEVIEWAVIVDSTEEFAREDFMAHLAHPSLSRRRLLHGTALAGAAASLSTWPHTALAQSTPEPRPTPVPVQLTRDVVYGEVDGTPLLLNITQPAEREAVRPAVVLFHGGGLVYGSRADVLEPTAKLARAGYVTFNVDYRLFNEINGANPWPAQLDDAQRAVRWVRANAATYGVDPERVAAYGHSSGGTLAAALGVRETRDDSDPALAGISSRVNCVVDLSGDMDLTIPYPDAMWTEINAAMLGGTPEEVPEVYRDASPLYQVDAESAPFLVLHGAEDTDTPVEHSRRLVAALQAANVEVIYGQFPKAGHLDIAPWAFSGPWVLTFLGLHLQPEH